ncbi:PAS domain-containing sensor histidine kinase [Candidatus Saccharibacteria bacterium]|nr:PAS domain-containing sensor histidine kinase [Candidatus Saccharibacteria bacterium]
MDYGKKYIQKLSMLTAIVLSLDTILVLAIWLLLSNFLNDNILLVSFWVLLSAIVIGVSVRVLVLASYKPINTLSDAIIYAGHSTRGGVAPDTESLKIGHEMVSALALQVYDLASMAGQSKIIATSEQGITDQSMASVAIPAVNVTQIEQPSTNLDHVFLPIIGIDSNQIVTYINKTACEYFGCSYDKVINKPLYDSVKMLFDTDETFELWLNKTKDTTVNSSRSWERVRISDANGNPIKQFDLAASFSKQTGAGTETMLVVFDRSEEYTRDDRQISFVALAVHELRTPLTIMRGYIEVFEDEVGPTLTPELTSFMHKMHASAQQLTSFVGNILNVARIEENQLSLRLEKRDWADILKNAINDLALRAGVHGKHIELQINGEIPPVAVDQLSIHEVLNNLVDNAIKYSGNSDKIVVTTSVNKDGLIETSVQDFGIGIPSAVMPDLFQKFYRSHKSRVQIGGTGLGLYLCKSIVTAHDGNIWVRSKEGEGSIFTFTIQAFDKIKHEQTDNQDGIMRGAHGWIKNHSLNRQ